MNAFLILMACSASTLVIWGCFWLVQRAQRKRLRAMLPAQATGFTAATPDKRAATAAHSQSVGEFYDRTNDAFVAVYGDVIQAFRTHDLGHLLHHQAAMMELKSGMKVLDAGCGVCGPALFFAQHYQVQIDAVTASKVQADAARERITAAGMGENVRVVQGDYHHLSTQFAAGTYDVVYFLESFGHSFDKQAAIASAWEMLKPGGRLYIKDLFVKEPSIPDHAAQIAHNVARINEAYRYNVGDLYAVLEAIRQQGFILSALKTIDIPLHDFENLTISNDFQELTGIHRIDNLQQYLFPVDFFEVICIKPWHDLEKGNSRYFLQNLYYMQVHGRSAESL
jgi:ubiquinone/menaquinone biosynthesis C-methylase UbiE